MVHVKTNQKYADVYVIHQSRSFRKADSDKLFSKKSPKFLISDLTQQQMHNGIGF